MTFDRDSYREDREAELGYSEVSAREFRIREWSSSREDAEFEELCQRLYQKKYKTDAKADPLLADRLERIRRSNREWARRNPEPARRRKRQAREAQKVARRRVDAPVLTCGAEGCGATWCRMPDAPGRRPRFCSAACQARTYYRERHPTKRKRHGKRGAFRAAPPRVLYQRAGSVRIDAAPSRTEG